MRTGRPTGLLEDAAIGLVSGHIPAPSVEQNARSLRAAIRKMNRLGITSYMNASSDEISLAAAASLRDAGRLTARAQYALTVSAEELADPATVLDALDAMREPYEGGLLVRADREAVPGRRDRGSDADRGAGRSRTARTPAPKRNPHWEPSNDRGPTYFDRGRS